jgi:hypothetical protein
LQVNQLKEDSASASRDYSSRMQQLVAENSQLKQRLLHLELQSQQQSIQAVAGSTNSSSLDQQQQQQQHQQLLQDFRNSLELAHTEQQNLSAVASAAQSECNRLLQQLSSSSSMISTLQDTSNHQQRQIEQCQNQIFELQSNLADERIQTVKAMARASAAEAEIAQISRTSVVVAAEAEKHLEDKQQKIMELQEIIKRK